MKIRCRNGYGYEFEKVFKNDNYLNIRLNSLEWGLGFNFSIGDSRRFLKMDVTFLHVEVWF
jgi:hypothetical protein